MEKFGIFVLIICLGSALAAIVPVHESPAQPVWPGAYTITGVIMLPYAEILEPFEAWFDRPQNRSRIDYYNGMVKTIQRGDLADFGEMMKIAPVANETNHYTQVCFGVNGTHDGPVGPQNVLPEMSNYTFSGMQPCEYADGDCEAWLFEDPEGDNKINRFMMLVQRYGDKVIPRAYEMQGYDTLFGSHFDKYIIVYNEISVDMPDASIFQPPNGVDCSNPSPTPPGGHDARRRHALGRASLNPMQEFMHNKREHTDAAFDQFKTRHNKRYAADTKEHHDRKFNFLNNFRYIESTNRKALSYRLAVNHMTDLSDDERRTMRGYVPSGKRNSGMPLPDFKSLFTTFATLGGAAADPVRPSSWDWRIQGAVTPVKDQAICGSCWTYGTTGAIEGANFVKTGKLVVLSQQSLIDCSWAYGNNGCDGGEEEQAYDWIMKNGGIMSAYDYGKYLGQDGYCHHDSSKTSVKLAGYYNVTSGDAQKLEDTIMLIGPTAVNIDASHKSFSYYANGVYDDADCKSDMFSLDHSVLAVGFGELKGQRYWLIKNSWSTYYGNDGYVLIAQKDNRCGLRASSPSTLICDFCCPHAHTRRVATQPTAVKISA